MSGHDGQNALFDGSFERRQEHAAEHPFRNLGIAVVHTAYRSAAAHIVFHTRRNAVLRIFMVLIAPDCAACHGCGQKRTLAVSFSRPAESCVLNDVERRSECPLVAGAADLPGCNPGRTVHKFGVERCRHGYGCGENRAVLQYAVSVHGVHADEHRNFQAGFLRESLHLVVAFGGYFADERSHARGADHLALLEFVERPYAHHIHLGNLLVEGHAFQQVVDPLFYGKRRVRIFFGFAGKTGQQRNHQ